MPPRTPHYHAVKSRHHPTAKHNNTSIDSSFGCRKLPRSAPVSGVVKTLLAAWLILLGAAHGKSAYNAEAPLGNFLLNLSEAPEEFPPEPLANSRDFDPFAYDCPSEGRYCHNDPVNRVDVLGLAEVVTTAPGGNGVLVNDETSFWLIYNMMAESGLVGKLDPWDLGAQPTFADAMLVAGKLGGTVRTYSKYFPGNASGGNSPNDLWIMPHTAPLPGNPGGYFDSGIIGMQASHLASGKGFYLDALDVRAIQAAGEATSGYPWGSLSKHEALALSDRGAVLTWLDTPLLTVGLGDGSGEYWGSEWGMWQPAAGPSGLGYAMGTTPWGTPRMVRNMVAFEIGTAGLAKGFGALRSLSHVPVSQPRMLTASARAFERTHGLGGNASTRNVQRLMDSMRSGGWLGKPISVFEHNGSRYILDGHHRVQAAMRVGIEVPYNRIPAGRLGEFGYSSADEVIRAFSEAGPIIIRVR